MRIIVFYLNLAFFYALFCFSNGMPPKSGPFFRFSDEEHKLIFKMLESKAQSGCYEPSIWKEIQKAHEDKVKAKAKGFPKCRVIRTLQHHFVNSLKNDNIKVSDALRNLHYQMQRMCITRQEQDFINKVLLESNDDSPLFSEKRWIDIQRKHREKRRAGEAGFANERSWQTLRIHFQTLMMQRNLVQDTVKEKFAVYFPREQGSTAFQDFLNELDPDFCETTSSYYTEQERELMFTMLEAQADDYKPSVWNDIKRAFDEKWETKADGFATRRSLKSLQQNYLLVLKSGRVKISDALYQVYKQMRRIGITPQERDFINKELSMTDDLYSCLNANRRWKKIQEKHDRKRESGAQGFANKRSWGTLRNHFNKVMKPKNLVSSDVKKRFPHEFDSDQGTSCVEEREASDNDPVANLEYCNNEGDDVWDPILEDLKSSQRGPVDSNGVDHSLFLDPIVDNHFYEQHSPYDLRTFHQSQVTLAENQSEFRHHGYH